MSNNLIGNTNKMWLRAIALYKSYFNIKLMATNKVNTLYLPHIFFYIINLHNGAQHDSIFKF